MTANKIMLLAIAIMLLSCEKKEGQKKDDSEIRYNYYNLENAGWKSRTHAQKADDINFDATEVPLPYYILKETGTDNLTAADSIYELSKAERIIEFVFKQDKEKDLLAKDYTGMDYQESVKYMSFSIEKDFYVVTSKNDTINCSGVTFERNFKIAPHHKLLLFFTGIPPEDKIQLVYNDRLFNKGILKFMFNEKTSKLLL